LRKHPARLERRLTRSQKALRPLAANPVVMNVAEKAHAVERAEHVLLLATRGDAVLQEYLFDFPARQHMPRQTRQELLQLELADVRGDLGQVFVSDLGGALVDNFLEAKLASPLVGTQRGQPVADGHQVTRPQERMSAYVLEDILFLVSVGVDNLGAPKERLQRICAQPFGDRHRVALQQADVVDEYLAKALRRVGDVHR